MCATSVNFFEHHHPPSCGTHTSASSHNLSLMTHQHQGEGCPARRSGGGAPRPGGTPPGEGLLAVCQIPPSLDRRGAAGGRVRFTEQGCAGRPAVLMSQRLRWCTVAKRSGSTSNARSPPPRRKHLAPTDDVAASSYPQATTRLVAARPPPNPCSHPLPPAHNTSPGPRTFPPHNCSAMLSPCPYGSGIWMYGHMGSVQA